MAEDLYQPPMHSSSEPEDDTLLRHPLAAAFLSLVVPGAGQLYNGRFVLGAGIYLTVQVLWLLLVHGYLARDMWQALITFALGLLLALASAIEAAVWAVRHAVTRRRLFHRWFVFLPVVLLLGSVPLWLRAPLIPLASQRPVHLLTGGMLPTNSRRRARRRRPRSLPPPPSPPRRPRRLPQPARREDAPPEGDRTAR